jgi:hypothetical protein
MVLTCTTGMDDQSRRDRATQRAKVMVLRKGRLGEPEVDLTPIRGAEAISLATRLTIESFSLAGIESNSSDRLRVRFIPRTRA